ncbi:hypothetical protein [Vibrio nigripulchritudo]|uniref:hypothetical protein n=1 Tax=Vibrio nigripulchritudo TaxID=28173 RepID=UPI0003B1BF2F|nr:hypothetical protein [Vibrio nigripulchritudo]CCN72695.1 hypothetical protein VIBNISFn118_640004 [Vibrio nigripulchritudo SFn118]
MNIDNKEGFVDTFLEHYLDRGFGSLSKSEIDILVMYLLMEHSDLKHKSNFELSLQLQITESRIKTIKHKAKLLFLDNADEFIKAEFFSLLHQSKLQGERKQGAPAKIVMVIEDAFVKQGVQAKLKALGHFADNSFNSEIVKITQSSFVDLIDHFFSQSEREKILQDVNQVIPEEDFIDFKALLQDFLSGVATKSGEKVVDLGAVFATGGASEIITLTETMKAFFGSDE